MHREISHTESSGAPDNRLTLYLLTALLVVLLRADLWPDLARGLAGWGLKLPGADWDGSVPIAPGLSLRLALAAALVGGARIFYGALDALMDRRVGADLAIAIACIAAILLKEYRVAAEVVVIGLVGECLEAITFDRFQTALRGLVELRPRRCWRLRDGQEERVLTTDLQVGDKVVVKPGGRVPADGVVTDGRSAVDVSAFTGESLPVDKGPGDEVLAGSLNQFGALTVEVRRVAEQTLVGRVLELTRRALKDKAPLERTADRLARWFLPVVLAVAGVTFLVALWAQYANWFRPPDSAKLTLLEAAKLATPPALAVLVVACPCALILATPAAVLAVLGRLAGTGVLIRGGSALERLAAADAFCFDKTGTLTEGKPELGDVLPLEGVSADEVLRAAAVAEGPSEHLIARLIVQEAQRRGLAPQSSPVAEERVQVEGETTSPPPPPPRSGEGGPELVTPPPLAGEGVGGRGPAPGEDFRAHPGCGVSVRTPEGVILVGNRRLLEEQGVTPPPEAVALLDKLDAAGQTALLVARAGRVLGAVGVRDRVRPEAATVLAELRNLGVGTVVMLTGDRTAPARAAADALALADYRAEVLPQQKAEVVAGLQAAGKRVAMVGDGINDAPALAKADVGLALAAGGDLAAEAGDVVLMGDPLRPLPLLVRLSREMVAVVRQNILWFAFGVNVVGVVVTAWLWPWLAPAAWAGKSPVAAVIYHQIGSVAVLLNSMRLLWFEKAPASPAYLRLRRGLGRLGALADKVSVEEGLHWLTHHWRPVAGGLLALLLAGYALSGLTQVEADEVAVVRRFGRPLPQDLGPGLSWRWPWPIEETTRVRPDRIEIVEVGFRSKPGTTPGPRPWSSPHGADGITPVEDEALMVTGDGNLVEVQCSVRYSVAQPRVFLFEVSQPKETLRSAAESVLREMIAGRSFADLLTSEREDFQREAQERLERRLGESGPHGLGIRLDGIALHDVHPPQKVVASYYAVTRAMEARDRRVNEALTQALSKERDELAKNRRIVYLAEADYTRRVEDAEARRDVFREQAALRRLTGRQQWLLWCDVWDTTGREATLAETVEEFLRRRKDAETLTDFRLFWNALTAALAGREKVILDVPVDKVRGRTHLWLTPFEPPRGSIPRRIPAPPEGP